MVEAATSTIGTTGERVAEEYLRSLRYEIRGRNVRFGRYEIDLVAFDPAEAMVVFVEVKTRTTVVSQYPIRTAVDRRKRRALRAAIARWVVVNAYDGPGRLDVVCVGAGRVVDHVVDVGSDFY